MIYRIGSAPIVPILDALTAFVAHQQNIMRQLINEQDMQDVVSIEELIARLEDGSTVLLDVRSEDEFAEGHLPGAISIPIDQLVNSLANIPADSQVIAYCRGPYCMLSAEAVLVLQRRGFHAKRLLGGIMDWRDAGQPVSS